MIRRNEQGTQGRKVALVSNNFKVDFKKPSLKIYQFDLAIVDPKRKTEEAVNSVPSKSVCEAVYRELKLGNKWAYDGKKNLYSPSAEPRDTKQ